MKRTVASNIPRYFVYTALKGFGFGLFLAVWVIYLQQQRGLSLSQAALIDVTFFVAAAFAEVPTGIVADRFGRKTSLTAGAALMSLGILGWTIAPTLPLIMVAYVAMGVGITFLSGAEDAFFYESLQAVGRAGDYSRVVGRVSAIFPGALWRRTGALHGPDGHLFLLADAGSASSTAGAAAHWRNGVRHGSRAPHPVEPHPG